jgi:hypothetical protein
MSYNEPYYDEADYDEYYEDTDQRSRLVLPLVSGCIGAILGFACAACLAVGLVAFLLPVGATSSEGSPPGAAETHQATAEPLNFAGHGKQTSPEFALDQGRVILRATHDGSGSFVVALLDSEGNQVVDSSGGAPLINELGPFNGSIAVSIQRQGKYLVDVTADGNWTVSIEP